MAMGRWGQEMWLSDRDFLAGMICAIKVKDVGFAALNLMSDNPGMRWDLTATKETIGYVPQDGSPAQVNLALATKSFLRGAITVALPRLFNRVFPSW